MTAGPTELQRTGYSIAGLRHLARRVLPQPIFDFADGGAETEYTLRRNEEAFQEIALLPQPLRGTVARDLTVTLFGSQLSIPLVIGGRSVWLDCFGLTENARQPELPARRE